MTDLLSTDQPTAAESPQDAETDAGADGLPTRPSQLFARLEALGIAFRAVRHAPVHTVAEAKGVRDLLPGGHTKNLFLRDKKKRPWLIVAEEDRAVDLKALARRLGAGTFSFASDERLMETLGVRPGSVTPLALVNDRAAVTRVVLDRDLMAFDTVNVHPLVNTMTVALASRDLVAFIAACGHTPHIEALAEAPA